MTTTPLEPLPEPDDATPETRAEDPDVATEPEADPATAAGTDDLGRHEAEVEGDEIEGEETRPVAVPPAGTNG